MDDAPQGYSVQRRCCVEHVWTVMRSSRKDRDAALRWDDPCPSTLLVGIDLVFYRPADADAGCHVRELPRSCRIVMPDRMLLSVSYAGLGNSREVHMYGCGLWSGEAMLGACRQQRSPYIKETCCSIPRRYPELVATSCRRASAPNFCVMSVHGVTITNVLEQGNIVSAARNTPLFLSTVAASPPPPNVFPIQRFVCLHQFPVS